MRPRLYQTEVPIFILRLPFLFRNGLSVAWTFIVLLQSYNDCVVETVTKWLCFYACEREEGTEREHYMDEYLSAPEREMVLSHFWLQVC